jgi:hypothetical protein
MAIPQVGLFSQARGCGEWDSNVPTPVSGQSCMPSAYGPSVMLLDTMSIIMSRALPCGVTVAVEHLNTKFLA